MNDLITALQNASDKTPEQAEAIRIDNDIRVQTLVVMQGLSNIAYDLKQMRDRKLYAVLGYETFEGYTENEHGIKARQAYKYIRIAEEFDEKFLQDYAKLGITKLDMLASLDKDEREQVLAENSIEKLDVKSTVEYKELLAEYKKTVEQLSFLENQPKEKEVVIQEPLPEVVEQIKKQLEEEYEARAAELAAESKKAAEQSEKLKDKLKAAEDAKKAAEADKAKAEEEKENALKCKIEAERAAEEARELWGKLKAEQEKAAAMEKQIKLSADPELARFKYIFENWQTVTKQLLEQVDKLLPAHQCKATAAIAKVIEVNGL